MSATFDQLSPVQQQVLTLLATGSTVTAAAETAGIHRNTISNWRRSSEPFRESWTAMLHEQAEHWRDGLQNLAKLALETLRYAMANMNTSPGVRVRAALAILNVVTTVPTEPKLNNPAQQRTTEAQNTALNVTSIDKAALKRPLDPSLPDAERREDAV